MRQVWKPNVTVAAIVEHDGRFLLVEEHTATGLQLNNPAGHLERGETPLQAVVREALEETTRAFTPEGLLGVYLSRSRNGDDDVTYLRLAFRGTVGDPLPGRRLDDGIVRTVWLTPDEVRASRERHRSPLVLQCIEDAIAGRGAALELIHADAAVTALGR